MDVRGVEVRLVGEEKKEAKMKVKWRVEDWRVYLCIALQHSPACLDGLPSPLSTSDLLTHHFSLYSGLEGKSEGHTHTTSCVHVHLHVHECLYQNDSLDMLKLYQACSLGAECPWPDKSPAVFSFRPMRDQPSASKHTKCLMHRQ